MAEVYDRWHRSRPAAGAPRCREHDKVPTDRHGVGDRWQVRWRDADRQQKKKSFGRKADAEHHRSTIDAALRAGTYVDPAAGSVTVKSYAEDWRKTRPHDVLTAELLERRFRLHVYPVLGSRTLRELARRPSLLAAWSSGLDLAPSTARRTMQMVSGLFAAAVDDGIIPRNPMKSRTVRPPTLPENHPTPWDLLTVAAVSDALPPRYAVLPYLGVGTGQRSGEMFGLAVDDVDFLRRTVHVRRQVRLIGGRPVFAQLKNRKPHDVPLADPLAVRLSEHIRQYPPVAVTLPWQIADGPPQTHRLILTRPPRGALTRYQFRRPWQSALRAAGVERSRQNGCHVLRHTAASAWLAAGVDVAAVADFLGDTIQTVVTTYAHMMPDGADRGRHAMAAFLTGRAPDVPPAVAR